MDNASISRLVLLIVALLTYFGINIPETVVELITGLIVSIVGLYAAYKNNYLFTRGKAQKEVLEKEGLYEKNK